MVFAYVYVCVWVCAVFAISIRPILLFYAYTDLSDYTIWIYTVVVAVL